MKEGQRNNDWFVAHETFRGKGWASRRLKGGGAVVDL